MLSFEDKIFIKNLRECKRFSARRLLKDFLTRTGNSSLGLGLAVDGVEH